MDGVFLLRIDDIDRVRSRPEYEQLAFEDLRWLGLTWPEPVMRQSRETERFRAALRRLGDLELTYPCSCSRRDIEDAAGAPQEGVPTHGPDGRIYPGTCRGRPMADFREGDAIRLDMARAVAAINLPAFEETGPLHPGINQLDEDDLVHAVGDVVVARKGLAAAYHLSVVVDDDYQRISHVVRGDDLFDATKIHALIYRLLDLPFPVWHHHRLIRDETGRRLAKRDDARGIARYREAGATPEDIRRMVGLA